MDKTSLLYWYPKLQELDIPTPKTWWVKLGEWNYYDYLEGKERFPKMENVQQLVETLPLPLFMRSDYSSAKHYWKETCYLTNLKDLPQQLYNLTEFHGMADIMGIAFNALVFREFLPLRYSFRAFKEMPMAREFRFFCKDAEVLCHHPYWPPESILRPNVKDWEARLKEMSFIAKDEIKFLSGYVAQFKDLLPEYWSVDFAQHQDGSWYLTDMAEGEKSYHWPDCELKGKEGRDE